MDHPNIAKVLDAGATAQGRPYFVMEFVKGVPITQVLRCAAGLDWKARLALFQSVCQAIQHAHQKGIIHRDIKPSNVLVTTLRRSSRSPKVIDFGVAKAIEQKPDRADRCSPSQGSSSGRRDYMSPEQAQGLLDIDTRSDVYSLGVLPLRASDGTAPFDEAELRKGRASRRSSGSSARSNRRGRAPSSTAWGTNRRRSPARVRPSCAP